MFQDHSGEDWDLKRTSSAACFTHVWQFLQNITELLSTTAIRCSRQIGLSSSNRRILRLFRNPSVPPEVCVSWAVEGKPGVRILFWLNFVCIKANVPETPEKKKGDGSRKPRAAASQLCVQPQMTTKGFFWVWSWPEETKKIRRCSSLCFDSHYAQGKMKAWTFSAD